MNAADLRVLAVLRAGDALDLDALVAATGLPRAEVEAALERLEAAGFVSSSAVQ